MLKIYVSLFDTERAAQNARSPFVTRPGSNSGKVCGGGVSFGVRASPHQCLGLMAVSLWPGLNQPSRLSLFWAR